MDNIKDLVNDVTNMNDMNVFKKNNFISRLAFPYFKNYTNFSEIEFDFPLTILVGKNGSGKSSALQALYGAPIGNVISRYWFSTAMDPIQEYGGESGQRHSYFYEYIDNNEKFEVLYVRSPKRNADYWETARPVIKYGMNPNKKKRSKPIEKPCIYLDFRRELSAFDKFFYFGSTDNLAGSKQDYLRIKSAELSNIIVNNEIRSIRSKPQNEPVIEMNEKELEAISFILQDNYVQGKFVKHKLFQGWGISVQFKRDDFTYSEAHAGSGEIAVASLVHQVLNAKDRSLILLDEPEVSLHPGAQRRLLTFLLNEIKIKKHQIVIASHSPIITEYLPKKAIKKFVKNVDTKKVDVFNECYPSEAFNFLGLKYSNITIHVEDKLAKSLIDRILKEMRMEDVEVVYAPGGESYMKRFYIKKYSEEVNPKTFVIFDGDQKLGHYDLDSLKVNETNIEFLNEKIKEVTGTSIEFQKDSGDGASKDHQIIEAQLKYLTYYNEYVKYLPRNTPEEMIWDDEYAKSILNENDYKLIQGMVDPKKKFYTCCQKLLKIDQVNEGQFETVENMFLIKWLERKDNYEKEELVQIIRRFLDKVNLEPTKEVKK